jgi:lipoyl(octanoyl) transferase
VAAHVPGRRALDARWLGRVEYPAAERLQADTVEARRRGSVPDTLFLLEHPPVITLGRGAEREHVLISPEERARRGIDLHETGRGGDVTYHGPGQLVGYPIVALPPGRRDVRRYLRDLEEALLRVVADYGVEGERRDGLTGVWVGDRKIAAIGVRISTGWVTSHGFALNVSTDLSGFAGIVPCGIRTLGVTSLGAILGADVPLPEVAGRAAAHVADVLGLA